MSKRIELKNCYGEQQAVPKGTPIIRATLLMAGFEAKNRNLVLSMQDDDGDDFIIELDPRQADAVQRALVSCLREHNPEAN
jgi:hypothetical protein